MVGALLNKVPESDDPKSFDFMGSTLVVRADSKEHVLEQIKDDIYVTSGVWDLDKVSAMRLLLRTGTDIMRLKFTPSSAHSGASSERNRSVMNHRGKYNVNAGINSFELSLPWPA